MIVIDELGKYFLGIIVRPLAVLLACYVIMFCVMFDLAEIATGSVPSSKVRARMRLTRRSTKKYNSTRGNK